MHHKVRVAGSSELAALAFPHADVADQPGQQGAVDIILGDWLAVEGQLPDMLNIRHRPAQFLGDIEQLTNQVGPLQDAQIVDELPLAELAKLVSAELGALLLQIAPQLQGGNEVRVRLETRMELIGLLLLL